MKMQLCLSFKKTSVEMYSQWKIWKKYPHRFSTLTTNVYILQMYSAISVSTAKFSRSLWSGAFRRVFLTYFEWHKSNSESDMLPFHTSIQPHEHEMLQYTNCRPCPFLNLSFKFSLDFDFENLIQMFFPFF